MKRAGGTTARVARNALLKLAVQGTRLLSLVFVVLAARALGPETFGKFTFAYALAALLGATLDLGMHSLLVRGVARARGEAAAQWATAATLKLALLVPSGLLFAVVPLLTGRPPDTTLAAWLLGTAIVLQSFIELAVAVFTGFERLEFEFGLRLCEKLLLFAVGMGGLVLGGGLLWVSGAFAIAGAASLALATGLVHGRFGRLEWTWHTGRARALAHTLGPVAGAFVLGVATTRLAPLMVALVGGDVAAGHFGAALRVLDVVMVVPVAVVAAVYPVLARMSPTEIRFREVAGQSAEILLLLGAPVALGLGYGAPWLVRWVYGAPYAATAPLLAVLGIAACLAFLNYFFGFVLLALDRPGRLLAVAAASFVASAALTPALVFMFGAVGGAGALVLVEAVTLIGGVVGLAPLIGLPLGAGAVKVGGVAVGAALGAALWPAGGGWRLGVALLLYAGGVLALRPVPVSLWGRVLRGLSWVAE